MRLLQRTTRRLALTAEGELYFSRSRQILTDIDEAEAEVAKSRGAPRGRLRVNTSNGFGVHQLAPALPDFLTRYPRSKSSWRSPTASSTRSPTMPMSRSAPAASPTRR